ncbi:hypothetical protein AB0G04_42840 [Actinoplanes sp. NPDC023801]|uniref:hypothetical protein n=1 Tax=Actinoplanes sp. NPDC023801 TaxID=3154595 RepID=UPI00340AEA15
MTTNQTLLSEASADANGTTEGARQRVTSAVRRNPKKTATGTTLALAAAAAAAVFLTRRRKATVPARGRNRLSALLNR